MRDNLTNLELTEMMITSLIKDSIHRLILQLSLVELANNKTHTLTLNTDNSLISLSSRLRLCAVYYKGCRF